MRKLLFLLVALITIVFLGGCRADDFYTEDYNPFPQEEKRVEVFIFVNPDTVREPLSTIEEVERCPHKVALYWETDDLIYGVGVALEDGASFSKTFEFMSHLRKSQRLVIVGSDRAMREHDSIDVVLATSDNKKFFEEELHMKGYPLNGGQFTIKDIKQHNWEKITLYPKFRRTVLHSHYYSPANGYERSIFYIFLLFLIVSIGILLFSKVPSSMIRHCAMSSFSIILFWIFIREMKNLSRNPLLDEYAWYLYYVAFIFIPLLFYYGVRFHGHFPRGKREKIEFFGFLSAGILLLIMVLSNHYTGFVFNITEYPDSGYRYNYGYYLIILWYVLTIFSTFILAIYYGYFSKGKWKNIVLVSIYMAALSVYTILYIRGNEFVASTDIVSVNIIFILLLWVRLLKTGFYPVNHHYRKLFKQMMIPVAVLDDHNQCVYKSQGFGREKRDLESKYVIDGGEVIVRKDLSGIKERKKDLMEMKQKKELQNKVLKEQEKIESELAGIKAQNKLYRDYEEALGKDFKIMKEEIRKWGRNRTPSHLKRIKLLLATSKRKSTILFSGYEKQYISKIELEYILDDLSKNSNCEVVFYIQGEEDNFYLDVIDLVDQWKAIFMENDSPSLYIYIKNRDRQLELRVVKEIDGEDHMEKIVMEKKEV